MQMRSTLVVAVLLFTSISNAHAGPDATTQELMDRPVTMLDWGILRMNMILNADPPNGQPTSANYDWETNRVLVTTFPIGPQPRDAAVDFCDSWFDSVRIIAGVDFATGKLLMDDWSYSLLAGQFTHAGFTSTRNEKSSDALAAEMDKKIFLEATVSIGTTDPFQYVGTLVCSGPLLDVGFSEKFEARG